MKANNDPFRTGTPIPPLTDNWEYGAYFVIKSRRFGKFPSFLIYYRVDDDCVYIYDMDAIKF